MAETLTTRICRYPLSLWFAGTLWIIWLPSSLSAAPPRYHTAKKLTKPDPRVGDRFGESIAVAGNVIAVGARDDDKGATNSGGVYLFDQRGTYLKTLISPNPNEDGWFGEWVQNVGDDKILISARREDNHSGRAYLFDTGGSLLHTFENPTGAVGAEFGARGFAATENKVLISAWLDASEEGRAYLFDLNGTLLQSFQFPDSQLLGRSTAFIGDDKIIIGTLVPDQQSAGTAVLFDLDGNVVWSINNPNPKPREAFGASSAYTNGRILIGAFQDDDSGAFSGAAHIYDLEGNLISTILDPEPASGNWFAYSTKAVDKNHFVIGSVFNDSQAFEGGEAYLVDLDGNIVHTLESPEPGVQHHFGISFAVLGNTILIGEHFNDGGLPDGKGAVWMFVPVDPGDFNEDGFIDTLDLNSLCDEISFGSNEALFDLNDDGTVNRLDATQFLSIVKSLPGDADLSGSVEFSDFLKLSSGFGQAGSWTSGDFDCTGTVDFSDFLILSTNFGKAGGAASASVPEPGMSLLSVIVPFLGIRRRRN